MRRSVLALILLTLVSVLLLASCKKEHTHEWGEWSVVEEPDCTTVGTKRRECACGAAGTADIPALGHTFVDGVCTVCGEEEPEAPAEPLPPENDPSLPDIDWFG